MASSVKSSMSQFYADIKNQNKVSEKKMATDDFYKQASQEFLKDAAVNNEQQGQPPAEEPQSPAPQPPQAPEPEIKVIKPEPEVAELEPPAPPQPEPPPIVQAPPPPVQEPAPVAQLQEAQNFADDFADDFDDFDFVDHYGDDSVADNTKLLPENTARSAINCAFVGIGGGGGKIAKAFLDLGFNRTVLINTTHKDQPDGVNPEHFLLLDGSDGVGKDVTVGRKILQDNATLVEDMLRARLGRTDWLFVCASGGGGTGSSSPVLRDAFERYLASVQAQGRVVYIVSAPSSQEMLNPTIKANAGALLSSVGDSPYIVVDNEKQLQLLRGKVGMLGMYPTANKVFAKMLSQILRLASESSAIQTFDTKDLEQCLRVDGRIFLGTCAMRNSSDLDLGLKIFKGCAQKSPCPGPDGRPKAGALLLVVNSAIAEDPVASNHMESAISYVGGRSDTLFSGVYIKNSVPGVISLMMLSGIDSTLA